MKNWRKEIVCIMRACNRGPNSCSLSVWWLLNSSQMGGPIHLKLSGHVEGHTGYAYFKNEPDWLRYKKLLLMGTFGGIVKKAVFIWVA